MRVPRLEVKLPGPGVAAPIFSTRLAWGWKRKEDAVMALELPEEEKRIPNEGEKRKGSKGSKG